MRSYKSDRKKRILDRIYMIDRILVSKKEKVKKIVEISATEVTEDTEKLRLGTANGRE